MPQFILNTSGEIHVPTGISRLGQRIAFDDLDAFTQVYVEAMFFTSTGTGDDGDLKETGFAELSPEALASIVDDCARFQNDNATDLAGAYVCHADLVDEYDETKAGRDFWYTRCGHGTGFWDRGIAEHGDHLSEAARAFGNVDLYRGDDGRLYLA